jgi:hypothetical protein
MENNKRTICTAVRALYADLWKNGYENMGEADDLIKYIYISAKKMNKKLCAYAGKIDVHDDEARWLDQLDEVRRENQIYR